MSRSDLPHPWPRAQQAVRPLNESELAGLRASIDRAGQVVTPIQCLPDGRIVDGHHRWRLARELGVPCPHTTLNADEEEGYRMAVELNVERRQLTEAERVEAVHRLHELNPRARHDEIAQQVGMTRSAVGKIRRELESTRKDVDALVGPPQPRKNSRATDAEKRKARLMAEEGMGPTDIGRQLGRPQTTISNWLKEDPPSERDELERRRHERHLRNQAAMRGLLDLNKQAVDMWRAEAALRLAIASEQDQHALVALASNVAHTQAMLVQIRTALNERLNDEQRERVRAFVQATGLAS